MLTTAMIEEYRAKGRKLLPEDKWNEWDEIIKDSKNGMYGGMDLRCILELLPLVNDIEKAKKIFNAQNHSGASAVLVCSELYKLLNEKAEPLVKSIYG